mmetsp:Transcript_19363/g.28021  ORF Transcript_19363/g.28021 Transcript_19363/m.28021 type:complete len:361 (-) Transcript_19363:1853-2935(-)
MVSPSSKSRKQNPFKRSYFALLLCVSFMLVAFHAGRVAQQTYDGPQKMVAAKIDNTGAQSTTKAAEGSCSKSDKLASVTKVSPNIEGSLTTPSIQDLEEYDADNTFNHHLEWKILPNYAINSKGDRKVSDTTTFIFEELHQALPDLSHKTVIDIGTVNGCTAFELERQGAKDVYAMDIYGPHHHGFKKLHKLLNSKVTFLQGSLYYLPEFFEAKTFDIIIFAGVIYHLRNPMSAVDALYKVLKPGGTLVVETAAVSDPKLDENLVPKNFKYSWIGWCDGSECNNDTTNTFIFTKDSLTSFFGSSGFTLKEMHTRGIDGMTNRLVAVFTRNNDRDTGYGDVNSDIILPAYPCPDTRASIEE